MNRRDPSQLHYGARPHSESCTTPRSGGGCALEGEWHLLVFTVQGNLAHIRLVRPCVFSGAQRFIMVLTYKVNDLLITNVIDCSGWLRQPKPKRAPHQQNKLLTCCQHDARLFSVKDTYYYKCTSAAVNITVLVNTACVNVFRFDYDTVVCIYIHLQQISNFDVPISCKQV